jgi:hypothetical protein
MKTEIEKSITLLASMITSKSTTDEALKYTQAALNLSHVLAILTDIGK